MSRGPEAVPNAAYLDKVALASLYVPNPGQLAAYRVDGGVDLMRFVETGEVGLRELHLRDRTIASEYAVQEPLLEQTFSTLEEYAAPRLARGNDYTRDEYLDRILKYKLPRDKSLAYLTKNFIEQTKEIVGSSEAETEKLYDCKNCRGQQYFDIPCFCLEGGSVYRDIEHETVYERPKGVADPDCAFCEGTGHEISTCGDCFGTGKVLANPTVTLINDGTGETTSFRLDVDRLIANGDVAIGMMKTEYDAHGQKARKEQLLVTADLRKFLAQKALGIGIDISAGNFTTFWAHEPIGLWGSQLEGLLKFAQTFTAFPTEKTLPPKATRKILRGLQEEVCQFNVSMPNEPEEHEETPELLSAAAEEADMQMDERLLITRYGVRLGAPSSAHEALQGLITTLDWYGYRLGFTYASVATGETGPALFVLDKNCNGLQEIESDYQGKSVLESAWRKIKEAHEKGYILTKLEAE